MSAVSEIGDLTTIVHSIRDKAMLEDFLLGITTVKERHELSRRIKIVQRLLAGQPQHKIAADLGVGVATVTRASKEIAAGHFKVFKEKEAPWA